MLPLESSGRVSGWKHTIARAITKTLERRLSENLMELCKRNDGIGDDDRRVAMITNVDWNSYSGLREFYGV